MPDTDLKNRLATYLYERDTCSLGELCLEFGSRPSLCNQLFELVRVGDVELQAGGMLEWQGTSSRPIEPELREAAAHLGAEDSQSDGQSREGVLELRACLRGKLLGWLGH